MSSSFQEVHSSRSFLYPSVLFLYPNVPFLYPGVLFLYPEVLDHDPKDSLLGAKDSSLVPVVLKRQGRDYQLPGFILRCPFAGYIKKQRPPPGWDKGDYKSPVTKVRIANPDQPGASRIALANSSVYLPQLKLHRHFFEWYCQIDADSLRFPKAQHLF